MDDLISAIDNFDLVPCEYRVLASSFDLDGKDLPGPRVLAGLVDPEEAIRIAKLEADNFDRQIKQGNIYWDNKEFSLVVVSVETVVNVEGEEQYVGTLFTEAVLANSQNSD